MQQSVSAPATMALVHPPSTKPIAEHVHLPSSIMEMLRRPEPINPPAWIRMGGEIRSETLAVPHRGGKLHRDVHFFVPNANHLSKRGKGNIPLLIAYHGSTEHGLLFRASTSSYAYDELACEEGFIVAYPDGYRGNWNDGRVKAVFPASLENVDDLSFTKAVIDHAAKHLGTSQKRTLLVGFSNGGNLLLRMLYEPLAPPIAGIALHCASLPEQENSTVLFNPSEKSRVPVILIHGTADPVNPYEGGNSVLVRLAHGKALGDRGLHMGCLRTARHLARNWGSENEVIEYPGKLSPSLVVDDWIRQEDEDALRPVVRLVSLVGEGHHISVPGGSRMPTFLGPALEQVHAPREVLDFFKSATNALD